MKSQSKPDDISKVLDLLLNGEQSSVQSLADMTPEELQDFLKAKQGLGLLDRAVRQERNSSQTENSTAKNFPTPWSNISSDQCDLFELRDQIGRFEIERVLGRGGFGVVLLARDPRLGRRVALKIPNLAALGNEEAMERFDREARTAAMLGHPKIVPIYESGSIGPLKYIAFEYCEGETLANWIITNGPLISPDLAARMIAAVAEAVQHAHSRGVIHRDLKPGNMMVDSDQKDIVETIRITDFGLASVGDLGSSLTRTGATIGTPAYMSPEQVRGELDEIGPRSDIYSLGAVLYELTTGKVPFHTENNLQTLRAIESQMPVAPKKLNSKINDDLQAICLKCLEKRSDDRYANSLDLADDLNRYLQGVPVRATKISQLKRVSRWVNRNQIVTLLAAGVFATMLAGILATYSQYREAQSNLLSTRQNYSQARAAVDDLLEAAKDPSLDALPDVRKKLLDRSLEYYNWFLNQEQNDPSLLLDKVEAYRSIGSVAQQLGSYADALSAFQQAQKLLDETLDDASPLAVHKIRFENQINIGLVFDVQQRLNHAIEAYEQALATGSKLLAVHPDDRELQASMARAYKNIGYVYREKLDFDSAMRYYEKALGIRESLVEQFPGNLEYLFRLSLTYRTLADWYIHNGDAVGGFAAAEECLTLAKKLVERDPENQEYQLHLSAAHNRLGDVYRNALSPDDWVQQAIACYEQAILVAQSLVKEFPLQIEPVESWFNSVANISDVYRHAKQYELAEKNYRLAQEILDGWNKANGSNVKFAVFQIYLRRNQGRLYFLQNNFEKAKEFFAEGIRLADQQIAKRPEYPILRAKRNSIRYESAKLAFAMGDWESAKTFLELYLAEDDNNVRVKRLLARILLDPGPGIRNARRAEKLLQSVLSQSTDSINTHIDLAKANYYLENYDIAISFLDDAKQLDSGQERHGLFVRAMVTSALGERENARQYFESGTSWLASKTGLSKAQEGEYQRLRSEAEKLLKPENE